MWHFYFVEVGGRGKERKVHFHFINYKSEFPVINWAFPESSSLSIALSTCSCLRPGSGFSHLGSDNPSPSMRNVQQVTICGKMEGGDSDCSLPWCKYLHMADFSEMT